MSGTNGVCQWSCNYLEGGKGPPIIAGEEKGTGGRKSGQVHIGRVFKPTVGYYFLNRRSTITDAASGVTTFGYNLAGQLTSLRDPENNDTTYARDLLGRVTQEENELGHSRFFVYDAASNLTLKKDRNARLTAYSFDDLYRLTDLIRVQGEGRTQDAKREKCPCVWPSSEGAGGGSGTEMKRKVAEAQGRRGGGISDF